MKSLDRVFIPINPNYFPRKRKWKFFVASKFQLTSQDGVNLVQNVNIDE